MDKKCSKPHSGHTHPIPLKKLIKSHGMSFTKQRAAILEILVNEHGPYSADEITQMLPEGLCDQATVFRTLKQFKEKDLVRAITFDEGFMRYEFNDPHHHHHHIICKNCQNVEVIDECILDEFQNKLAKKGFTDIQHSLEFYAICPNCQ